MSYNFQQLNSKNRDVRRFLLYLDPLNDDGNLVIYTGKKNKKHLCNPKGESLFYMRCVISSVAVKKYQALNC